MTWPVLDESYIGFGMDAKTSVGVMIPKCTQRVHLSCETVTSRYTSHPLQRREVFPPHTPSYQGELFQLLGGEEF